MSERLLVPRPQRVERRDASLEIREALAVAGKPSLGVAAALDRLELLLAGQGVDLRRDGATGAATTLGLGRLPAPAGREAYRLEIGADGIEIAAGDDAGLSHGLSTLTQWLRLHGHGDEEVPSGGLPPVPGLLVEDRPDLAARGVLLDISRCRVPTMPALLELVDLLASWKINHLQLYMEHTFAYRGHELVWRHASPMTADEIRELDAFCAARHVELVPNQNSCGHLHRWLVHEPYRRLAECPDGIEHPFSREREPFGLCTTDPAALELLADLYGQLLPCFSSSQFHVGLDETIDLGRCRSRREAERLGVVGLYRRFLGEIHRLAARHGRRIQIWGDIVAAHPTLLDELPPDTVVMEWGYEADHDFDRRAARLAATGLDFHLCPGTSSWLSFAGRLGNARTNIAAAAEAARRHGAVGLLVTDWGDQGHLQPLPASLPGLLMGAAFSWRTASAADPESLPLPALLARHVLSGRTSRPDRLADRLLTLADLYRLAGGRSFNGSPLFHLLLRPDLEAGDRRIAGIERAGLERCVEVLDGLATADDTLIEREVEWIRDALAAAARLGVARLGGAAPVEEILAAMDGLIARHGPLWIERSRPGGREESCAHLERARRAMPERLAARE